MGQTAEPLCPRRTHMEQMLICLSIALIAGLLMSRLAKAVNFPAVTSYLVAGLLLGPFVLGRLGLSGLGIGFGSLEQVESQRHLPVWWKRSMRRKKIISLH